MKWFFKCLDPKSKSIMAAVDALGKHGAFECLCAVSEAQRLQEGVLDVQAVANWAGVKRDRAAKILSHAQAILDEALGKTPQKVIENYSKSDANVGKNYGKSHDNLHGKSHKSNENLSEILPECDENLLDFDASNPRGSILDIKHDREERIEIKETTTTDRNPPAVMIGGGRFFEIEFYGEPQREDEWLLRCFLNRRKAEGLVTGHFNDLEIFLQTHSEHFGPYMRWITQPIEARMAAYIYTTLETNATDPLKYAVKAAEKGKAWPEFMPILAQVKENVRKDDYRVVING